MSIFVIDNCNLRRVILHINGFTFELITYALWCSPLLRWLIRECEQYMIFQHHLPQTKTMSHFQFIWTLSLLLCFVGFICHPSSHENYAVNTFSLERSRILWSIWRLKLFHSIVKYIFSQQNCILLNIEDITNIPSNFMMHHGLIFQCKFLAIFLLRLPWWVIQNKMQHMWIISKFVLDKLWWSKWKIT